MVVPDMTVKHANVLQNRIHVITVIDHNLTIVQQKTLARFLINIILVDLANLLWITKLKSSPLNAYMPISVSIQISKFNINGEPFHQI